MQNANGRTNRYSGSDDDGIAEFESKEDAEAVADDNLHCQSGFYSIEEADI